MLGENSETYRDTVNARKAGFAPSFRFGIGKDTDVTLAYYYLKTKDVTDYGQPNLGATFNFDPPPVPLRKYYGFAKYDYTEHDTQIASLKVDHKISNSLSLRNTLRWANYKREMEATIATINKTDANGNAVTAATPLDLLLATRSHNKARDNDDVVMFNQTDLTWKVATGAIKHTVLSGVEIGRENLNRWNYTFGGTVTATTSLLNPDPQTSLAYTKTPNQRAVAEANTFAASVQDQMEFSKEWKALLGVRWERIDSTVQTENFNTGAIVAGGGPFARADRTWSGRSGVIWQPTARQSYYVAAGNSYSRH
jgi:catecholate siderophore receptor